MEMSVTKYKKYKMKIALNLLNDSSGNYLHSDLPQHITLTLPCSPFYMLYYTPVYICSHTQCKESTHE